MTALYIIGGFLLLILLFLLTPLRARAEYNADGFIMRIRLLFFTLAVITDVRQGKLKVYVEKVDQVLYEARGAHLEDLVSIRRDILPALAKLFKGLRVHKLKVWYLAASDDAAQAALQFGQMQAVLGGITAVLEHLLRIEKKDYRVDVSFSVQQPEIYIEAKLSLTIWRICGIILGLFRTFLREAPVPPVDKQDNNTNLKKGGSVNG